MFAIGSVMSVIALAYIRAHTHRYVDGHFIWGSIGLSAIAVVVWLWASSRWSYSSSKIVSGLSCHSVVRVTG
jgi:hypothetical protein